MSEDPIVVEVTFSPLGERWPGERKGVFIFTIPDLIVVRNGLFSRRHQRGPRKDKHFLREQLGKNDFDWNVWVFALEGVALALLLVMGLGHVRCKACNAEYPKTEMIVWDWAQQNRAGLEYTCPHEHPLFTRLTHWGEFLGDDERPSVHVRHVPGTNIEDVFNNR